MATSAYYRWVAEGRPFRLAVPVAMYRDAFYAAGWPNGSIGTIGDEAHLQSNSPQDHTPFSVTGWPLAHPYPRITALDVSHGVSRETILDAIVAHWVLEARAKKTPWVKYIIYKGQSWGVRDGWAVRSATGHYDHAHVSMRTDYVDASIGAWNPLGTNEGGNGMWDVDLDLPAAQFPELLGQTHERAGTILAWTSARVRRQEVEMAAMNQSIAAIASKLNSIATIDALALAQALVAQPGFVQNLAAAVATRIGEVPTAQEIAAGIGALTFQVRGS